MISYKDRTFCQFYEKCGKGETCGRALTDEVAKAARESGMDICQYAEPPGCMEANRGAIDGEET